MIIYRFPSFANILYSPFTGYPPYPFEGRRNKESGTNLLFLGKK